MPLVGRSIASDDRTDLPTVISPCCRTRTLLSSELAALFSVRGGKMGQVLTCGLEDGGMVSPVGRAVVGSTVADLADGRAGPEPGP